MVRAHDLHDDVLLAVVHVSHHAVLTRRGKLHRRQARARRAVVNRVFQPVPDRVITQPSVVTARVAQQKAAITYKAPAADVSPGPDMPPPPPADEETPILPPPPEGELPHKAMPGWIPYAAAGGLAVVFWVILRRKKRS